MGYKLAGYDVIGCNEIDPKLMEMYMLNHHPKYHYREDIRTFLTRTDIPPDLFDLDILDGSPPCSSFSMAGKREKDWGKEKKFREGQAHQTLDDLFFEFIKLGKRLQPKIIISENVEGILFGNAKKIASSIFDRLTDAGYNTRYFILNSSTMGVPQSRKRVFFISTRKDLPIHETVDLFYQEPAINILINEPTINYSKIRQIEGEKEAHNLSGMCVSLWDKVAPGNSFSTAHPRGSWFNEIKVSPNAPLPTLRASAPPYDCVVPRKLYKKELILGSTFPLDYDFNGNPVHYVVGMSVPPVMMAHIANQVYHQLLSQINKERV